MNIILFGSGIDFGRLRKLCKKRLSVKIFYTFDILYGRV
jgi:hypothetical protein